MKQELAIFGLILVAASIQVAGWIGHKENGVPYQTASAPGEGVSFAVRFVGEATAAEIAAFLETYKATIITPPLSSGLHRVRLSAPALPKEELAKLIVQIGQEKVVEFVALQQ